MDLYAKANNQHAYIVMFTPQQTSASDLVLGSSAAQQLAYQMIAKWPHISSFSLTGVTLPALGLAITV